MNPETKLALSLASIGAVVGIGKLLASTEKITVRIVAARAIISGALGLCAAAASLMFPNISTNATIGVACVLSSLGSSAVESVFQKWLSK
ncbi:hypothetical protein [Luteibacter sp. 22Crub2.1]|uniref:hypothetical protein n=1 Tax=Luteibacter sp. 22Crub2.1 TaxID=1283288 RepID=UPI0009A8DFC4|nr:hypothetical protein [Luteibacter sp. 22Crub2.1]SKB50801.1 Phage holin family 2 [Luteibacter sp. 22Crub2.1]